MSFLLFFYRYSSVAEHPFLDIFYKTEPPTVTVGESRKKLVLDPRVDAVPPPDMIAWYVVL